MKTRDRIVDQARLLFNALGYGRVTTAALAAQLGIAEGNLWYHFKTKRAILDAIAADYAGSIETRLALHPTPGGDVIADYCVLLDAVTAEFRRFRFLFRDQPEYGDHADQIAAQAPRWIERSYAQLHAYYTIMVDQGLLVWPRDRLADLAVNAIIILRYGLEHYRELGVPIEPGGGAVRGALVRHLTLFEHQLQADTAARLRRSIDRIDQAEIESQATA